MEDNVKEMSLILSCTDTVQFTGWSPALYLPGIETHLASRLEALQLEKGSQGKSQYFHNSISTTFKYRTLGTAFYADIMVIGRALPRTNWRQSVPQIPPYEKQLAFRR